MPTPEEIEAGRLAVRELRNAVGVRAMDSELAETVLLAAEKVRLEKGSPCGLCGCLITENLRKK